MTPLSIWGSGGPARGGGSSPELGKLELVVQVAHSRVPLHTEGGTALQEGLERVPCCQRIELLLKGVWAVYWAFRQQTCPWLSQRMVVEALVAMHWRKPGKAPGFFC